MPLQRIVAADLSNPRRDQRPRRARPNRICGQPALPEHISSPRTQRPQSEHRNGGHGRILPANKPIAGAATLGYTLDLEPALRKRLDQRFLPARDVLRFP